jgi:hypothetical protein
MMKLWSSYEKENVGKIFSSLNSMEKGVGSGVGSGYGSIIRGMDPDPHQNVTNPQHCCKVRVR